MSVLRDFENVLFENFAWFFLGFKILYFVKSSCGKWLFYAKTLLI